VEEEREEFNGSDGRGKKKENLEVAKKDPSAQERVRKGTDYLVKNEKGTTGPAMSQCNLKAASGKRGESNGARNGSFELLRVSNSKEKSKFEEEGGPDEHKTP